MVDWHLNGSHGAADAARDLVGAEMVRAAVAEFLGMERSLREAAKHLAAAEGIGCVGADVPAVAAMAARVTLAG